MSRKDVVRLYQEGYSVSYIVKEYYRYRTRNDVPSHYFNGNFINTRKSISMQQATKEVFEILLDYLNGRK